LIKKANEGDLTSQIKLAFMYAVEVDGTEGTNEALKWAKKAHDQSPEQCHKILTIIEQISKPEDESALIESYRKVAHFCSTLCQIDKAQYALEYWIKAANLGDVESQFHVGKAYENGEGVAVNYEEAFRWYLKAAQSGDYQAQNQLGYFYDIGGGVKQDYKSAYMWYEKSAQQGFARAKYNLGLCFINGQGIEKSISKGLALIKEAAEKGDSSAQFELYKYHRRGLYGIPKNQQQALSWLNKAATGSLDAQCELAQILVEGSLAPQDQKRAVALLQKGVQENHAPSMRYLGYAYLSGEDGLAQDQKKGFALMLQAAKLGCAQAQYDVGTLLKNGGVGTTKDMSQAIHWLEKAVAQKYPEAYINLANCLIPGGGAPVDIKRALKLYEDALPLLTDPNKKQNVQQGIEMMRKALRQ
jgi:TPR repeat protein